MEIKCKNCANCTYDDELNFYICERREQPTDGEATRPCFKASE